MPADQRASFELKIDMPAIDPTSGSYGDSVASTVNKVFAENSATYASIEKVANFAGKKMYAYIAYPTLALVGGNPTPYLDPNTSTLAGATIQMSVTANGSDIYLDIATSVDVITTASSGSYIISGQTFGSTGAKAYIIKTDSTGNVLTGLNHPERNNPVCFSVYPNPSSGNFTFQFKGIPK